MKKEEVKKLLQNNLDFLQSLSIPEYTLYRKWIEINNLYKKNDFIDDLFGDDTSPLTKEELNVKNNIWKPDSYNDYMNLQPTVIHVKNKKQKTIWNTLRIFCHRMPWHANPGRLLKFYVINNVTGKYLGLFSLGSDFISVGGRDEHIGWTQDQKLKKGMLKHTAMGSTIAATQPLGYNYLGGKLMALLITSDVVENAWNNKYKEELAGITTTSIYGGFSQYNNLKYWKKCKSSEGTVKLEPSEDVYEKMRMWMKENRPDKYPYNPENGILSHPKTRVITFMCKELGVNLPVNNAPRGVYFCSLYDNTRNFLSMKDEKLGNRKFDNSVNSLSELWKYKYAKKRINKLSQEGRYKDEILFYDDMIGASWEEIKKQYLED